jgi:DNA (cytosine-5)-methyltransferase 1
MTLRYLDVCAGISAASVAWQSRWGAPINWQCAGYSEIDPFPRAVLEQQHGAVAVDWDDRHTPRSNITPLFGDFTKIEAHHVGSIDLLVGGTPCQSFSVAGKRLGLDDPRGNLAIEFLALARRLGPRWLVWENVPGVYSSRSDDGDGGTSRDFLTFLNLFRECGYRGGWRTLDAQYVRVAGFEHAVPQRRRRVFLVGYLGDAARATSVLFDRESLCGHPAPRREAWQGIAPTISVRTHGGGGLGTDFDFDGGLMAARMVAFGEYEDDGTASTLKQRDWKDATDLVAHQTAATLTRGAGSHGKGGYAGRRQEDDVNLVAHALRADGFDASEDGTGRGTPLVPVAYDMRGREGGAQFEGPHFTANIRASAGGSSRSYVAGDIAFAENSRAELRLCGGDGTVASQLTTGGGKPGQGQPCIASQWAVRRLTPRECERLQGFPDDFTAITWRGKPAADSPRYKALGNSMAVNAMRWIGQRIDWVERITNEVAA